MSECDLAIVGAGAAGLAAARRARALGLSFELIEAKSRIGGRAFTERDSLGIAWDRGAHWLHSADENPLTEEARRLGHPFLARNRPLGSWRLHRGSGWAGADEIADYDRTLDRPFEQAETWGAAGLDRAVAEAFDPASRWLPLQRYWCRAINGGPAEELSAIDLAHYNDSGENWPLERGYGTLVAALGQDVPVSLATTLEEIEVLGANGVLLLTSRGEIRARAAILTVSTNLLRAERIRFRPGLPVGLLSALEVLPTGAANKVAFRFSENVFDMDATSHLVFQDERQPERSALSVQIRPFGEEIAIAYFGGDEAERLERAGAGTMTAVAREVLTEIFGAKIWAKCLGEAETAWASDPHTLGAYAYRRPGHAGDPRAILREPIAERVLLAGEACHPHWFSTVHGAWESGREAVETAARLIGGPEASRVDHPAA